MNDFNLLFQIMQTETLETPTSITEMNELFLQRLYFCSPVLTSVATKNGMAIIKIGREALFHLQRIAKVNGDDAKNCSRRNKDKLITASTNVFKLKPDPDTQLDVRFKISFCKDAGNYVSVFVEICDPEQNHFKSPFAATFFLRNMKDENGHSFKKRIKLSSTGSRIERGIVNFLPQNDFNHIRDEHSIISFGILIERLKLHPINNV